MPFQTIHLSDEQLTRMADGEVSTAERAAVAAHLEACWSCRERLRSIEGAILDFTRARNLRLNGLIADPSGPRALLKARLTRAAEPRTAPKRWSAGLTPAAALVFPALVLAAVVFSTTVSAEGPRPKPALTPGDTRPITLAEVCRSPRAEVITANIPKQTRELVLSEYGIKDQTGGYELDYLITPDLGGSGSPRNLWPQPYSARWNARLKDRLEERLHELVCSGQVDLATAQHDIASDWIQAYRKYIGR